MDWNTKSVIVLILHTDLIYLTVASLIENGIQAPIFLQEPLSRLTFSNDSGSQISCSAHGNPSPMVTWVLHDGSVVSSVPGLRQTSGNGTLYFPPFLGQYFRADVHEGIYRCKASNTVGTILSRNVYVHAVVRKFYDIRVEGKDVYLGNVAFLRCFIPEYVREYVKVTSWYRDDEILLPELADISGRYAVTSGAGDLHIRAVKSEDGLKKYSCLATNSLNGERKVSESVTLSVKDMSTNMAPRTNQKPVIDMFVDRGNDIHLPCNIQGNPLPVFTWFRVSDSNALYPVPSSQRIIPSQTLLLIKNADERDTGKWVCKASNQFGDQRIEIRLHVNSFLSVHIHPQVQIVNSGGTAIFNCSITGTSIENVEWFHDGTMIMTDNALHDNKIKLLTPVSLAVNNVGRNDKGIYQCSVTNKRNSAQAMAELKLGDTVPELIYTFIEQNVRPGPYVSLKCSATGSPPPQFTWLLDSQPIIDVSSFHRYAIGQYVDISGDVISHLNISHVRADDGGLYTCVALNSMGSVEHAARLNVYGPPFVRAIGPLKAVAGIQLIIRCPFSGYPIESIRWEKSRQEITPNTRYEIATESYGDQLKINNVDSAQDSGLYTCIVRSRAGEEARRDMQLTVNNPPVIESFKFPKNLQEGGRAQVTCAVSSGDMPVYFSWKKDDAPISISLQITEKKDEFFSLLVFKDITARHSGRYTCFASNSAAKVNYTAELLVRVPPKWIHEPKDTALMLGNTMIINCFADGYPQPTITWFKGEGKSSKEFKSIHLKNSSLVVNFATELDEGFYMCQVSNGIGHGLKKIIHVNINEPARFDTPMKNVSSRRNDPITLNCLAQGDEPLNIIWTHNNARIDLHNYRLNIGEMKTEDGINSQLSISRSDRQDSGVYKCLAENPFGKSDHIIYLAVQEPPDTPSNLEIIEISSRSVKLAWKRPFDGNSPVLSYVVQYQPFKYLHGHSSILNADVDWNTLQTINITLPTISSGTRSPDGNIREQATLAGLHPSTTYLVRMLAINEIERSSFTDPIVIKTREEAPVEAPQNIQVQSGGIGELIVTWQLPPKESWNGDLISFTINCTEEKQNINYISPNDTVRKLIKVEGFLSTKTTITNLRTYRRYSVSIRANNGFGAGPWSMPVYQTTLEGIPEAAPQHVNCTSLSSQSIKIVWIEPLLQYHGGVIQGYKILYAPLVQEIDILTSNEVKRTSNLETYLHALYKATNYSIRVLAYTSVGDGVPSNPVYCSTEDDVPEPPLQIKAAALTADSILVSWLPPKHKNGNILHYTVYSREAGKKGQARSSVIRVDEYGNPVTFEARNLNENQIYEFWVSASTSIGEGEPTAVVAQTTNTRAPARIASFSQTIRKSVGSSLSLECLAVGLTVTTFFHPQSQPHPRARWFTRDRPVTFSPFYEVAPNGNLKIHSIEVSLSGNYTCSAKNLFGEDHIVYTVIAMKPPISPQIVVHYASSDSIRISWDSVDDGGAPIQGFKLSYRIIGGSWTQVDFTPENTAYTIVGLKCGTQYILKMSAVNRVAEGRPSEEIIISTKGKKPQEPEMVDLLQANSSCVNLNLSSWNNGGCAILHFSIEHRPLGHTRWTVVTSDISNSDENRENLVFCEFASATWYQLKMSATNDAGKTNAQYYFATTNLNGDPIPKPDVFPEMDQTSIVPYVEPFDWLPYAVVGLIVFLALLLICVILKHRGVFCGPISEGYESRTIPGEYKDDRESRRNQQVYSASPVKTVDKCNDSGNFFPYKVNDNPLTNNSNDPIEMYEISPYATFSVSGGRTCTSQVKTPTRGVNNSTLDYTVQFKTFGHPEGENLNATAYPMLPSGFGHVKGKSSWHKQRFIATDDESTLSKSMTIMAGSSQLQSHRTKPIRSESRSGNRNATRHEITHLDESESDTSGSPINEFSNTPTYRVPTKSSREAFRPDSSTESNNDNSPVERRSNTPRHVTSDVRSVRTRPTKPPRESKSMDLLRSGSNNNSLHSEVNLGTSLHYSPRSVFSDSREFSEAECDRERALDLEVQRVMENNDSKTVEKDELTSLLARYQEKKEQERQEYIIHV